MKNFKLLPALTALIVGHILLSSSTSSAQTKGGRWVFENNGNDMSTWDNVDNNGSLSGAAIFSNTELKIQGDYYLSLEDSSNYGVFIVADQEELDFHDENFAASLWIYPIDGYDNPQYLLMKGDRSGNVKTNNYALRINNKYLELIVHSETGANKVAKSSFEAVKYEWNFIAVFYDYANSKLYIWNDNETAPIDTLDFNAPLFPNDNKLYIGTSGENGFKRFWGRIDDVRIGNKVPDIIDHITSINLSENKNLPMNFKLSQNYPNPFNPETSIEYQVVRDETVILKVYDVLGNEITTLVNEQKASGKYKVKFDASNLSSGIYFYRLSIGNDFSTVKKMNLLK